MKKSKAALEADITILRNVLIQLRSDRDAKLMHFHHADIGAALDRTETPEDGAGESLLDTTTAPEAPSTIALPLKPLRSWEGYSEPDEDELESYMAQPYTRIVDAKDQTVFTAHDLFTFSPGHAEFIVKSCNSHGRMLNALRSIAEGEGAADEIASEALASLPSNNP